jgi:hypothetical protein
MECGCLGPITSSLDDLVAGCMKQSIQDGLSLSNRWEHTPYGVDFVDLELGCLWISMIPNTSH